MTTPSPFAHRDICQAREQLMEDISAIIEGYDSRESPEYLAATLCDAVCKNFPSSDPRRHYLGMHTLEERIRSRIRILQVCLQGADTSEERDSLTRQINNLWRQLSDQ